MIHFLKDDKKMIIDLDDLLSLEELKLKIIYEDGEVFETRMDTEHIKAIKIEVKYKQHRKIMDDKEN